MGHNDDNIVRTYLTAWCGTRRSFFGSTRCTDGRDILNSTIGAGPSRTEQNVSHPGRGVLAYRPRDVLPPCQSTMAPPRSQDLQFSLLNHQHLLHRYACEFAFVDRVSICVVFALSVRE